MSDKTKISCPSLIFLYIELRIMSIVCDNLPGYSIEKTTIEKPYFVTEGKNTSLICRTVIHGGQGSIVWTRSDDPETELPGVFSSKEQQQNNVWMSQKTIYFIADRSMNVLDFRCTVKFRAYTKMVQAQINVFVMPTAPVITLLDKMLPGRKMTFRCQSDSGNPAASLAWQIGEEFFSGYNNIDSNKDGTYNSTSILRTEFSREDHGKLVLCYMVHEETETKLVDELKLVLKFLPRVTTSATSYFVSKSAEIMFDCNIMTKITSIHNISWVHNEKLVNHTEDKFEIGGTLSRSTLTIKDIQTEDSGVYICQAWNSDGVGRSPFIQLSIIHAPVDTEILQPNNLTLVEGDGLSLLCRSDAVPPPHFRWLRNGVKIGQGSHFTVEKVYGDDDGVLMCEAENSEGKQSAQLTVTVHYPPKGVRIVPSQYVVMEENDSALIECETKAKPPATYTWFRGDNVVSRTEVLNISHAKVEDSGKLKCLVNNSVGSDSAEIKIIVGSVKKYVTLPNSSTKLYCDTPQNSPSIFWTKDDVRINMKTSGYSLMSESDLGISEIRIRDEGVYKCYVSGNVVDVMQLTVKHAPRNTTTVPAREVTVKKGEGVVVLCQTDAYPSVEYSWWRDNVLVGTESQLRIDSTNSASQEIFTCKVVNSLGKDAVNITVFVHYAPNPIQLFPAESVKLRVGGSATFQSSVDASPPASFMWYRGCDKFSFTNIMTIEDATHNDTGVYRLVVWNRLGVQTAEIEVIVGDVNTVTAVETFSAVIDCPTSEEVVWTKNDIFIVMSSVKFSKSSPTQLQISHVLAADKALYKCLLGTKTVETFLLQVQYAPRNTTTKPESSMILEEGMWFEVKCLTDAFPPAVFSWFLSSKRIAGSQTLVIRKVQPVDGNLTCVAENQFGKQNVSFQLIVEYAPRNIRTIPAVSWIMEYGETQTAFCETDANPPALYWWYAETAAVSHTEEITISNSTMDDTKLLTCQAINPYGSVSLQLQVIVGPVKLYNSDENSSLVLHCGNVSSVTWSVGGSDVRLEGRYTALSSSALQIQRLQTSDEGTYKCYSSQQMEQAMIVTVNYSPRNISFVPPNGTDFLVGERVVIKCISKSRPPAYYMWYVNDTKYFVGESMTISSVLRDPPVIKCVVKNSLGNSSAVFTYVVHYAPSNTRILPPVVKIEYNGNKTVRCLSDASPSPSFDWMLNKDYIGGGSVIKINYSLFIENSSLECIATNRYGFQSVSVHVIVSVDIEAQKQIAFPKEYYERTTMHPRFLGSFFQWIPLIMVASMFVLAALCVLIYHRRIRELPVKRKKLVERTKNLPKKKKKPVETG